MLSHSPSDPSSRLRRAKSTSSVQDRRKHPLRPKSIDPDAAHLQALLAAHRAMERSSERSSAELRRSGSSTSRRGNASQGFRGFTQNVRFSPATKLKRQQSRLQSRTHAAPSVISSYYSAEVSNNSIEDSPYKSSPTHASEFGYAENYGAQPSSYRRLKKAKSFLIPKAQAVSDLDGESLLSPISTSRTLRNVKSSLGISEVGIRLGLKRSLSYLRSTGAVSKTSKRPETVAGHHEEAIHMARAQYLRDLEQQTLLKNPSMLFHPKVRHQQKAFRKSVRTSRLTDFGDGVKSANQDDIEDRSDSKFRSFSASVRDRMMRVFGKAVNNRDKVPAQQLEATRQHFGDSVDDSGPDGDAFDHYQTGDADSTSRRSLYIPATEDHDTMEDLDRMSANLCSIASRESLHSGARSRVTSWTNSTLAGSLRGPTPLERKRLSIIKEDGGPHQPSSSAGRHLGGVSLFREPMGAPVDSQRVYSALMRRIDQEQEEMERTQKELGEIHRERELANKQAWRDTTTIRAVPSQESIRTIAPDRDHREFNIGVPTWEEQTGIMTTAKHLENVKRRKKNLELQAAQSSFFPFCGGAERKIATTPSPFKLSLMERRQKAQETEDGDDHEIDDNEDTANTMLYHEVSNPFARRGCHPALGQGRYGMSADSVYSRTTNGGTNPAYLPPTGSSEDVGLGPESEDSNSGAMGMATIIPTKLNRYQYPKSKERIGWFSRQRGDSESDVDNGGGSVEWRAWMEGGICIESRLERHESKASQLSHFREKAQIDGDDVEIGSDEPSKRFPLLELKEVSRGNTPAPRRSGSQIKSREGLLLKRRSMGGLSREATNDENRRFETLRKISPGNMAKMLTGKASRSGLTLFGSGKEGESELGGDRAKETPGSTPPISTPGRLMVMYGNRRKAEQDTTPTGGGSRRKKGQYWFRNEFWDDGERSGLRAEEDDGSPEGSGHTSRKGSRTGSAKKGLFAARLSRPFDMDVPGQNRPFDSMFLGKGLGESDSEILTGKGRLSVAPAVMSLGVPGVDGNVDGMPGSMSAKGCYTPGEGSVMELKAGVSVEGRVTLRDLGVSSKRMVSDFLKRRRGKGGGVGNGEEMQSSSAAFL